MDKNIKISLAENLKSLKNFAFLHQRSFKKASESLEYSYPAASRRQIEKEFLDYITIGNVALAEQYIKSTAENGQLSYDVGNLSDNHLMQARFSVVAVITLFCRTAVDCGLPEPLAFSISDVHIQYLSNINDEEKIYHLSIQVFLEYCQALQDWRLSSCSPQLKLCCEYIMSHLYTKITMAELGKVCALSPNYISDLFDKELGMRPTTYIRQEKMKYAAYLLKNSTSSVADIAELLAFPSASAFTVQFRDIYGTTPHPYRKSSE
jgi:AraC-like DNA-binding protein